MSLYTEGLKVRNAGIMGIETPSSIKTRLDRDNVIFKRLNTDMVKAAKAGTLSADDAKAWKIWGEGWLRFYEDSEGYFDRLQGVIGGLVDQLTTWEKEMSDWYAWAKYNGIALTGPAPSSGNGWFGQATPYIIGLGLAVGVVVVGYAYLNRGPSVPIKVVGTGKTHDVLLMPPRKKAD